KNARAAWYLLPLSQTGGDTILELASRLAQTCARLWLLRPSCPPADKDHAFDVAFRGMPLRRQRHPKAILQNHWGRRPFSPPSIMLGWRSQPRRMRRVAALSRRFRTQQAFLRLSSLSRRWV